MREEKGLNPLLAVEGRLLQFPKHYFLSLDVRSAAMGH